MFELTYLARPLIGAVIGYITNDIAIRMLFRPRTAKYIFGMKLPFTPGLIPKEKARIAASIGNAVSANLMNREVLEKTLLSDEMIAKISHSLQQFIDTQRRNEETVEQFILHYITPDELLALRQNIGTDLSAQIHGALANADLGGRIADMAIEHIIEKVKGGMLGIFGAEKIVEFATRPLHSLLQKNINEMLANHSRQMVGQLLDDQMALFLQKPVRSLFEGRENQIESFKTTILTMYRRIISRQLPKMLDTLNISRMIEERINEMDVRETERLILEVMNKELRAIVWLGALLGFAMGCVNLLF